MVCFYFNEMKTKKTLIGLGLGQIISLLSTLIASIASEIARKGISAPTSQTFLGYVSLAIVYGGIMLYRRSAIKVKWYHYFLLAVVDVEANFLVVKAFQNTSMTSIMLLDCWAIPCVLVLTWVFLKTRYRLMKISGVVICIVGVVMVVFSDVHAGDRAGGSNPVKGDFLVIAGATLYAVSNVTEEFLVKNADVTELMAFLGLFGAIIAAIQISIFERGAVRAIQWSTEAILLYIGGALGLFLFYTLITILIKNNGSTMFNLSLLTSDMWAILIRTFGYHEKVDWLYFLAFATTATGLIIYSMKEKDEEEQRSGEVVSERRKLFDEEDGDSLHSNLIDAST
ncbi:Solute carrier family 35 member SLC35F1/F2/F6 [Arabidopsis thaliana x Arabidopsis arenosa]|uniref:Solute carrier family 35 member SLC35F1/F2/F6 n=1 Tax=Arabidopsis thaliana x Arabidopsis arenosa TaxID=1240361 RepID=A0A8T2EY87_9BRAS|nr:Solute carrier family 35 member SLC35F1/F2/F6 [Arabidopsis thaliana x Arabidopsis arenosa]